MGYFCVCGLQCGSPDSLVEHLRIEHPSRSVINDYYCLQNVGCRGLVFDSLGKFENHLRKWHMNDMGIAEPVEPANGELPNNDFIFEDLELPLGENNDLNQPNFETFVKSVHDSSLMFVSKLYNKDSVSRCIVQEVVSFTQEFCASGFISILQRKVMDMLANIRDDEFIDDIREIEAMFAVLEQPFSELDTETKRISAFTEAGVFIAPEKYLIGSSLKPVQENGVMHMEMVPAYGQFNSMCQGLKSFLELPHVFDTLVENYENLIAEHHTISNFVQGHLWARISARFAEEGKRVFPLFLFSDEFEPDNALGSHAGDHKINALYYKIPCIPKELMSALRYIFVAGMFFGTDRKEYGYSPATLPILNELRYLEETGIVISLPDRSERVYFALGLVLGDNLGQNAIFGYVECFVANYFCRVCKVHRNLAHNQITEDVTLLRNRENYEADVALNDVEATGIKEGCDFNDLMSFHVTENETGDALHDVEEGACGYALPLILHWLIVIRQYFTYETFCQRVEAFDYGPSECGNKPPVAKLTFQRISSCSKFSLSGSESLCLTRLLAEIIGDLVPEGEEVWAYYLTLRELLDLIFVPQFEVGTENLFKVLVEEHHEMFIAIFDETLKPVHHFLLHYWRYMRTVGPPIHTSTKRWESKHREGKLAAHACNSRIDLLLTLSIKSQLKYCYQLLSRKGLNLDFLTSVGSQLRADVLPYFPQIAHLINIDNNINVTSFKFIEYGGTLYKVGMVVVFSVDEFYPRFAKIEDILIYGDSQLSFILRGLQISNFDHHFHAFKVHFTDDLHCKHPRQLPSYQPLWIRHGIRDGANYVSLRFAV